MKIYAMLPNEKYVPNGSKCEFKGGNMTENGEKFIFHTQNCQ